jgi:crossover junction endodeoxyribonuclease RusA
VIVQRSIVITLPIPRRELSPNARCHWHAKRRAVKAAREIARWTTTIAGGACLMLTAARIDIRAFHATDRRRDRDNLIASCKPYFDGLADAGLIANDSGFTLGPVVFGVDKEEPRIELEVSWETRDTADSPGRSAKASPSPSRSTARRSARSS